MKSSYSTWVFQKPSHDAFGYLYISTEVGEQNLGINHASTPLINLKITLNIVNLVKNCISNLIVNTRNILQKNQSGE